jgi:hypothetical protein
MGNLPTNQTGNEKLDTMAPRRPERSGAELIGRALGWQRVVVAVVRESSRSVGRQRPALTPCLCFHA